MRHPLLLSALFVLFAASFVAFLFGSLIFISSRGGLSLFPFGSVAVVRIEGAIYDSREILEELEDHRKNDSVRGVVLRIDSPGGAVAPSQEIFAEVKKLREKKKVVASMGTVAASGGYYIAAACEKIFASPGTVTGSIGVIMESFDLEELMRWAKLDNRVIKSGGYKDIGNPFREMTPEERKYLQNLIDDMYGQFKEAVGKQRGISEARMEELAQGKIYTGEQAKEVGLVDEMGTVYDAVAAAKKMAGLSPGAHVIWPRDAKFPFNFFTGGSGSFETSLKRYFHAFDFPVWLYRLR
ncbi:MAG: signal peptide peptidase SppA [Deltaproteobacteria bacterium]|nr:signal peptide peptidase SppA [Deltaproteobacteria bacterium]